MKTLTLTTAIGVILLLPASVIASPGEDVTIRVMEMHENAKQVLMNQIPLPEFANEEARVQAMKQERERATERLHEGMGDFQAEQADEIEQELFENDMQGGRPRN